MATTDHFEGEDVIITFEEEGKDNVYNYEARITNLAQTGGTGDVETTDVFGGKSITTQKQASEFEISFDYITRDTTFDQMQFGGGTSGKIAAGDEITSATAGAGPRWRIVLWFIGGEGAGKANLGTVVVPKKVGELMRWIFKDCYVTSNDGEMAADDMLKGSITFKLGAVDSEGKANIYKEWTSGETTTALTTLTTSHGGALTRNTTTVAWTGSYRT